MERKTGNADLFSQSFQAISENDILSHRKSLKNSDNFKGAKFTVETNYNDGLDLKNVSLSLSVEKLQYDNMDEFVELKLQQSLQNVQFKKDTKSTEKLLEQLEKPDLAGQLSF
jgi:wyosine [tRNA(Phe)-imidazoG37] synthetase (radical SAM superfamily)